ncbi:MAG TPA: hypothetical protein VE868_02430 [Balneolaceae bacterium]|nr:hypothetical protein [Balneolaceae bacterium]
MKKVKKFNANCSDWHYVEDTNNKLVQAETESVRNALIWHSIDQFFREEDLWL